MVGNSKKLNLVIILTGGYGFPIGDAYTNRILSFAKGFVKNDCKVTLLIIYPGRNNQAEVRGTMNGFDYIFCAGLKYPKNWLSKKYIGAFGVLNALKELIRLNKKQRIDTILAFSQYFSQNFPLYLFTRFNKILFIRENNEFPGIVLKRGHSRLTFFDSAILKISNLFYDGFIYISSALVSFNMKLIRKGTPVEIVPIIVDHERFDLPVITRKKWITYCGHLFGEKDGIKILLEAFSTIHHYHPDYKLLLVGDISNKKEFSGYQNYIKEKEIQSKVKFTGFVHRDIITRIMMQSSVLVLARPDNIQAKGGFPTKLGEYLASGRPVLVTSVSDIPKYIYDSVNGYLAKPDSIEDFANKLNYILSNYNEAAKVGLEGKKLSETVFNNEFQASRIIHFIYHLKGISK
jgi:glycosyltransferase involved in cell wall biosynthesis